MDKAFSSLSLLLIICFGAFGFIHSNNADREADRRQKETNKAFCQIAKTSWDQRRELTLTLTAPSTLSPALQESATAEVVVALQKQIDQANLRKANQRVHLLTIGGDRPTCES